MHSAINADEATNTIRKIEDRQQCVLKMPHKNCYVPCCIVITMCMASGFCKTRENNEELGKGKKKLLSTIKYVSGRVVCSLDFANGIRTFRKHVRGPHCGLQSLWGAT